MPEPEPSPAVLSPGARAALAATRRVFTSQLMRRVRTREASPERADPTLTARAFRYLGHVETALRGQYTIATEQWVSADGIVRVAITRDVSPKHDDLLQNIGRVFVTTFLEDGGALTTWPADSTGFIHRDRGLRRGLVAPSGDLGANLDAHRARLDTLRGEGVEPVPIEDLAGSVVLEVALDRRAQALTGYVLALPAFVAQASFALVATSVVFGVTCAVLGLSAADVWTQYWPLFVIPGVLIGVPRFHEL
ncbi:MAG: hypothetical protein AAGI01_09815 [Myxococcota bacterium]